MNKFTEKAARDVAIPMQDIDTADVTGAYYPVADYRRLYAGLITATVAQTKAATLQFFQAKDAAGTGAKALGAEVSSVAPNGGAKLFLEQEAYVSEMDSNNGFTHVALKATCNVGSAVQATALLIRDQGRYSQ